MSVEGARGHLRPTSAVVPAELSGRPSVVQLFEVAHRSQDTSTQLSSLGLEAHITRRTSWLAQSRSLDAIAAGWDSDSDNERMAYQPAPFRATTPLETQRPFMPHRQSAPVPSDVLTARADASPSRIPSRATPVRRLSAVLASASTLPSITAPLGTARPRTRSPAEQGNGARSSSPRRQLISTPSAEARRVPIEAHSSMLSQRDEYSRSRPRRTGSPVPRNGVPAQSHRASPSRGSNVLMGIAHRGMEIHASTSPVAAHLVSSGRELPRQPRSLVSPGAGAHHVDLAFQGPSSALRVSTSTHPFEHLLRENRRNRSDRSPQSPTARHAGHSPAQFDGLHGARVVTAFQATRVIAPTPTVPSAGVAVAVGYADEQAGRSRLLAARLAAMNLAHQRLLHQQTLVARALASVVTRLRRQSWFAAAAKTGGGIGALKAHIPMRPFIALRTVECDIEGGMLLLRHVERMAERAATARTHAAVVEAVPEDLTPEDLAALEQTLQRLLFDAPGVTLGGLTGRSPSPSRRSKSPPQGHRSGFVSSRSVGVPLSQRSQSGIAVQTLRFAQHGDSAPARSLLALLSRRLSAQVDDDEWSPHSGIVDMDLPPSPASGMAGARRARGSMKGSAASESRPWASSSLGSAADLAGLITDFRGMTPEDKVLELSTAMLDADVAEAARAVGLKVPTLDILQQFFGKNLKELMPPGSSTSVATSRARAGRGGTSGSKKSSVAGHGAYALPEVEAEAVQAFLNWWSSGDGHYVRTAHLLRSLASVVLDADTAADMWQEVAAEADARDALLQEALLDDDVRQAALEAGFALPELSAVLETVSSRAKDGAHGSISARDPDAQHTAPDAPQLKSRRGSHFARNAAPLVPVAGVRFNLAESAQTLQDEDGWEHHDTTHDDINAAVAADAPGPDEDDEFLQTSASPNTQRARTRRNTLPGLPLALHGLTASAAAAPDAVSRPRRASIAEVMPSRAGDGSAANAAEQVERFREWFGKSDDPAVIAVRNRFLARAFRRASMQLAADLIRETGEQHRTAQMLDVAGRAVNETQQRSAAAGARSRSTGNVPARTKSRQRGTDDTAREGGSDDVTFHLSTARRGGHALEADDTDDEFYGTARPVSEADFTSRTALSGVIDMSAYAASYADKANASRQKQRRKHRGPRLHTDARAQGRRNRRASDTEISASPRNRPTHSRAPNRRRASAGDRKADDKLSSGGRTRDRDAVRSSGGLEAPTSFPDADLHDADMVDGEAAPDSAARQQEEQRWRAQDSPEQTDSEYTDEDDSPPRQGSSGNAAAQWRAMRLQSRESSRGGAGGSSPSQSRKQRRASLERIREKALAASKVLAEAEAHARVLLAAQELATAEENRMAIEQAAAEAEAAAAADDDGSDIDEPARDPSRAVLLDMLNASRVHLVDAALSARLAVGPHDPAFIRPSPPPDTSAARLLNVPTATGNGTREMRADALDVHSDASQLLLFIHLYKRCARQAVQAYAARTERLRWERLTAEQKRLALERQNQARDELARRKREDAERAQDPAHLTIAERMTKCRRIAHAVLQAYPAFHARQLVASQWRQHLKGERSRLRMVMGLAAARTARQAAGQARTREERRQRAAAASAAMAVEDALSRQRERIDRADAAARRAAEALAFTPFEPMYDDDTEHIANTSVFSKLIPRATSVDPERVLGPLRRASALGISLSTAQVVKTAPGSPSSVSIRSLAAKTAGLIGLPRAFFTPSEVPADNQDDAISARLPVEASHVISPSASAPTLPAARQLPARRAMPAHPAPRLAPSGAKNEGRGRNHAVRLPVLGSGVAQPTSARKLERPAAADGPNPDRRDSGVFRSRDSSVGSSYSTPALVYRSASEDSSTMFQVEETLAYVPQRRLSQSRLSSDAEFAPFLGFSSALPVINVGVGLAHRKESARPMRTPQLAMPSNAKGRYAVVPASPLATGGTPAASGAAGAASSASLHRIDLNFKTL